jgi:hypothetical protein
MATFNKFNIFVANLAHKIMDLSTSADALKVALSNTLPVATNQVFADIVEISSGNGYTAGGTASTISSSGQVSGTYRLISGNVTFTASGGTIGPFRYVVIYDSTPSSPNKPLIGWYDFGSNVTLNSADTFTVAFDQTNGVLSIT